MSLLSFLAEVGSVFTSSGIDPTLRLEDLKRVPGSAHFARALVDCLRIAPTLMGVVLPQLEKIDRPVCIAAALAVGR